jgi:hypothetical protein
MLVLRYGVDVDVVVVHTINESRLRSRSRNIALAYLGGRGRSHVVVSDSAGPGVTSIDDTRTVLRIRYCVSSYWIICILRHIVTPGVKAMY